MAQFPLSVQTHLILKLSQAPECRPPPPFRSSPSLVCHLPYEAWGSVAARPVQEQAGLISVGPSLQVPPHSSSLFALDCFSMQDAQLAGNCLLSYSKASLYSGPPRAFYMWFAGSGYSTRFPCTVQDLVGLPGAWYPYLLSSRICNLPL